MESKTTVYGAYWCPDCRRSKKFLGENFIPYNWVDIEEDKQLARRLSLKRMMANGSSQPLYLRMALFWWNHPMRSLQKNLT